MLKKFRNVVALAAALVVVSSAQAQSVPSAHPMAFFWESGAVAAGAAITMPAHVTSQLSKLTIVCDNSLNASTAGTLTISYFERDCVTAAGKFTVSCATSGTNGGYTFVQIASDQPGVSTTGLTQLPLDPPYCLGLSVAAAGSVARQVSVYGRP